MFENDHMLKINTLQFWLNNVETGNWLLSLESAKIRNKTIRQLSASQIKLAENLRRLIIEETKQC